MALDRRPPRKKTLPVVSEYSASKRVKANGVAGAVVHAWAPAADGAAVARVTATTVAASATRPRAATLRCGWGFPRARIMVASGWFLADRIRAEPPREGARPPPPPIRARGAAAAPEGPEVVGDGSGR